MSIFSDRYKNYDEFMYDFAAAALQKAKVREEFEILSYDIKRVIVATGADPDRRNFCIRIWSSNNYNFRYSVFEYIDGANHGTEILPATDYILPAFEALEDEADRIWNRIYNLANQIEGDSILMDHFEKYFPEDMDLGDLPGAVLHYLGQRRYLLQKMGTPLS